MKSIKNYKTLHHLLLTYFSPEESDKVKRAYDFAAEAHKSQKRKSSNSHLILPIPNR